MLEIRFTKSARKHRIGKASARYVMARTAPRGTVTRRGDPGWLYVGVDERGRELEIVAVEIEADGKRPAALLVLHVQPNYRKEGSR